MFLKLFHDDDDDVLPEEEVLYAGSVEQAAREAVSEPATHQELMENPLELLHWIANPDAKKDYKHLNKDIVLANLTDKDISIITEHWDLAREYEDAGMPGLVKDHVVRGFEIALASQGRHGFRTKWLNRSQRDVSVSRKRGKRGFLK